MLLPSFLLMLLSAVDFLFCSVLRWVIEDRAGEV